MKTRLLTCLLLSVSMVCLQGTMPAARAGSPPGLQFTDEGLVVDAGSLGKYTLEYPTLLDASKDQPAHKLIEKTPAGASATLQYEGGARVSVSAAPDGTVTMKFASLPADVKAIGVEMKIPIEFSDGGTWKIGASGGPFPKEKPSMPHLYQDHARALLIAKGGHSLELKTPEYSFLQLTDNREWNWSIYNFRVLVPAETVHDGISFSFGLGAGAK